MYWPSDANRHVDPNLGIGLKWWGGGIENGSMASASHRNGRMLTCLYDTLTLRSWCEWLAARDSDSRAPLVLHVDDHRDLGSPRLFIDEGGLCDAITGDRVSMTEPDTVAAAISSGAIGMGSFLTPFLYALPGAEIRHLCQPPKATKTSDFVVEHITRPDTLIDPTKQRPAVLLRPETEASGPGTYRVTPDLRSWLGGVPEGPTLLHIDMDYFNNRYDGDSGWHDQPEKLDPNFEDIAEKIKALGDALRTHGIMDRIEDAVVAYSPGFFPAEYWKNTDLLLREHLSELYAD
ncbi:MAG TPA: hypothetical protein VHU18_03540 [Rhizomicrobium sp.]|jgi:hypothetical protein|nr:hypothetical protein [Rhizomicrobium sp.]